MSIDPRYIPAFSIEEVMLDKDTGAPLSGGIVTFEQADQPGVKKNVWQITNTSGNYTYTQLPNPMILSAIGTFQDSLDNPVVPYFFPFDASGNAEYYRVIVESSEEVSQFVRDPVPYIPEEFNPGDESVNVSNELSNPQFAEVLFDTTSSNHVYTITGAVLEAIPIAPNWDIVVTGTGTVTVSQSRPVGSLNRPTNPGTLLNIDSTGITFLRLRQRIDGSPNLFGSGYIAGFFVAKTFGSSSTTVTMFYSQSDGVVVDKPVVVATLPATGAYTEFPGSSALIPASTSSQSFPDAYVDIELSLPVGTNLEITSVQAVSTGDISVDNLPYDQNTNPRQIDHEFHYYQPQINFKPIPSLLTAWDFPLNPAQARGTTVTMNTTAAYVWDQTIGKSAVGNVAVVRNAVTGGIQATTANADEAFYWIQYLTGAQAKKMLGNTLSVNVSAFRTQAGGATTARVYLYRGSSAASFPTIPTTIGTLAASGVFTLTAANWTEIPRGALGLAQGTLSVVNTGDYSTLNDVIDLSFNGWEITATAQIADTDKFAIVVTYQCPTTGTVVVTDSISVVPGDIPTRPAPQTPNQVLEESQQYYETSSAVGTPVTSTTATNSVIVAQETAAAIAPQTGTSLYTRTFGLLYKTNKIKVPTTNLYSETGTLNNVTAYVYRGASGQIGTSALSSTSLWTQQDAGTKGLSFVAITSDQYVNLSGQVYDSYVEGFLSFHYAADARLGV